MRLRMKDLLFILLFESEPNASRGIMNRRQSVKEDKTGRA